MLLEQDLLEILEICAQEEATAVFEAFVDCNRLLDLGGFEQRSFMWFSLLLGDRSWFYQREKLLFENLLPYTTYRHSCQRHLYVVSPHSPCGVANINIELIPTLRKAGIGWPFTSLFAKSKLDLPRE